MGILKVIGLLVLMWVLFVAFLFLLQGFFHVIAWIGGIMNHFEKDKEYKKDE